MAGRSAGPDGQKYVPHFDVSISDNFGYVYTSEDVTNVIKRFEVSTVSAFVLQKRRGAKQNPGMEDAIVQVILQVEDDDFVEEKIENETAVDTREEGTDLGKEVGKIPVSGVQFVSSIEVTDMMKLYINDKSGFNANDSSCSGMPPLHLDGHHKKLLDNVPESVAETSSSDITGACTSSTEFIGDGDDSIQLSRYHQQVKYVMNEREQKNDNSLSNERFQSGNKVATSSVDNQYHCSENSLRKTEVEEETCTLELSCENEVCEKSDLSESNCDKNEVIDPSVKPFKCQFCEKSFTWKWNCKTHEMTHTDERPFKCQYCEKSFIVKANRKIHEMAHTGNKPFNCQFCKKTFTVKRNCQMHEMIHTSERPFNSQLGWKSVTKEDCETHEMKYADDDPSKCQCCEKTFIRTEDHKMHEGTHQSEGDLKCQCCEKLCMIEVTWEMHEMDQTGDKPFKCQFCKKSFNARWDRTMHERIHTGEKPFKCKFCVKSFTQKGDCKTHEMTHTGEKPFKCQYCEKSFRQSQHCKSHEKTHTNEKPFKCGYCEKSFIQRKSWKLHEMRHTGDKRFKCQYCAMSYSRKGDCRRHVNTTHR